MMNVIWCALLGVGVFYAAASGSADAVSAAVLEAAGDAVRMCIDLAGFMCLWLGLLRIADASGLVTLISRLTGPLLKRLFPSLPPGHPALGAISMNFAANLLGLGNAATPLGLKAMAQLQELNPQKDTATAAMITLLAMNTSGVTLLPTLVISLRESAGSQAPAEITGAAILASSLGFAAALLLDALFRKAGR